MTKFDLYKLAIDARDKLNENYHKWMTFYYVANGAILVAIITIITGKPDNSPTILLLSVIGILISMFWNLSCKGYYYWSKSWIEIIIRHEKELIASKKKITLGVYSIFSNSIKNTEQSVYKINGYSNISTPKLTMIFSFFVIICWTFFSLYTFSQFDESITCKIIIGLLSVILISIVYGIILPKLAKSRNHNDNLHNMI